MSCLYIAVGQARDWKLVKFGITKFDRPDRRVATHSASAYNPYGVRVRDWRVPTFVTFEDMAKARCVETALKSHFLRVCPRVWSDEMPQEMSITKWRRVLSKPSGEWLIHPGTDIEAVEDFFGMALPPLADAAAVPGHSQRTLALAHEAMSLLLEAILKREWLLYASVLTKPEPCVRIREGWLLQ